MSADTERFGVASSWASLAHWLAWAMDAAAAEQTDDAAYNLGQFWSELESWKQSNLYPAEWGDLGRMDALSNLVLASVATNEIHKTLDSISTLGKFALIYQFQIPPLGLLALLGKDPARMTLESYVKTLQQRRGDAARNALDLAKRAAAALSSAGLDTSPAEAVIQAAQAVLSTLPDLERQEGYGVVNSTPSWGTVAANVATSASDAAGNIIRETASTTIPAVLRSVPWWAWVALAGAIVLVPLLMPRPQVNVGGR